ncbi:metal ABC transporter permease [candidate division WOR-3 bacterium]|nr:metal ABC transporter permease [candidate division WOR-3 bacterium]
MLEIFQYQFFQRALLASVVGGAACGIVGVWVVLMRIPFVGVAMSHAAFAGAIFGLLLHIDPLLMAVLFCLASTSLIGPVADRGDFDPNISIGIIFSIVLGIAFLGMGLIRGPKTEALNFIWGNILTITSQDVLLLVAVAGVVVIFLSLLYKEIKAVLFNRELARAVGIPEKILFYCLLFLCGTTVTFNLNTIGGLLIFSLIVNPPSAAFQLTYNLKTMYLFSVVFAIASCMLGLFFSYFFNVPSGAVIIIVSSCMFGVCLIISPKRRVMNA